MSRCIAISLLIATTAEFGSAIRVFAHASESATPPTVTESAAV